MATTKAYLTWTGPESDVLGLWVDAPTLHNCLATATDDDLVALLVESDEHDEPTGRIIGLEIVGFLEFDRWERLPTFSMLWQVDPNEPRPLVELLKQEQQGLRQQTRSLKVG